MVNRLAIALLLTACHGSEPCTASDLKPIEDRYSTAIDEACAQYETLTNCPHYEPLLRAFEREQDRVCK